jgi:hypothetical protein
VTRIANDSADKIGVAHGLRADEITVVDGYAVIYRAAVEVDLEGV